MTELTVYIPAANGKATSIKRGSAIVGHAAADGVLVDFEGNLYGADNLKTFEERLQCAAGRHDTGYPTTARRSVEATDVVAVATAKKLEDSEQWVIDNINNPAELQAWLDAEALPTIGGSFNLCERLASRAHSRFAPGERMRLHQQTLAGQSSSERLS